MPPGALLVVRTQRALPSSRRRRQRPIAMIPAIRRRCIIVVAVLTTTCTSTAENNNIEERYSASSCRSIARRRMTRCANQPFFLVVCLCLLPTVKRHDFSGPLLRFLFPPGSITAAHSSPFFLFSFLFIPKLHLTMTMRYPLSDFSYFSKQAPPFFPLQPRYLLFPIPFSPVARRMFHKMSR